MNYQPILQVRPFDHPTWGPVVLLQVNLPSQGMFSYAVPNPEDLCELVRGLVGTGRQVFGVPFEDFLAEMLKEEGFK